MSYKLKSGQINFEKTDQPGSYSCVVIKNGEIHNMTHELREILLKELGAKCDLKDTSIDDLMDML